MTTAARLLCAFVILGAMTGSVECQEAARSALPYRIQVVDADTGRGVPLVELATVHGIVHVTDSAGLIAFDEPGLMDADVFFFVTSHGYQYPKDGFGNAGLRLHPTRGGSASVRLPRTNLAQRIARLTGQGIYRDSLLLGERAPLAQPLLAGGVLGQDSVQTALYHGRIYWFWGDTSRASYPLGNFAMSGATSELPPGRGGHGLPPSRGVDFTYFTGPDGFSRGLCPIEGQPGPVWCDGMTTLIGRDGKEALYCRFARMKSLGEMYEQGLARFDDQRQVFVPLKRFALDAALVLHGQPVRVSDAAGDFWYFADPFPLVRCRADEHSLADPAQYEAYTCLEPGARWDPAHPRLERRDGKLVYGWKRDTAAVRPAEEQELVAHGLATREELACALFDARTKTPVRAHSGSVAWNEHRHAWVLIAQELGGSSLAGEVWYAEAPSLVGPWRAATKIVTHDDYSFYNVAQHPFFDEDGGRVIYFEGTYSREFSGTKRPTPRYDYNQILYALDVDDPRLHP